MASGRCRCKLLLALLLSVKLVQASPIAVTAPLTSENTELGCSGKGDCETRRHHGSRIARRTADFDTAPSFGQYDPGFGNPPTPPEACGGAGNPKCKPPSHPLGRKRDIIGLYRRDDVDGGYPLDPPNPRLCKLDDQGRPISGGEHSTCAMPLPPAPFASSKPEKHDDFSTGNEKEGGKGEPLAPADIPPANELANTSEAPALQKRQQDQSQDSERPPDDPRTGRTLTHTHGIDRECGKYVPGDDAIGSAKEQVHKYGGVFQCVNKEDDEDDFKQSGNDADDIPSGDPTALHDPPTKHVLSNKTILLGDSGRIHPRAPRANYPSGDCPHCPPGPKDPERVARWENAHLQSKQKRSEQDADAQGGDRTSASTTWIGPDDGSSVTGACGTEYNANSHGACVSPDLIDKCGKEIFAYVGDDGASPKAQTALTVVDTCDTLGGEGLWVTRDAYDELGGNGEGEINNVNWKFVDDNGGSDVESQNEGGEGGSDGKASYEGHGGHEGHGQGANGPPGQAPEDHSEHEGHGEQPSDSQPSEPSAAPEGEDHTGHGQPGSGASAPEQQGEEHPPEHQGAGHEGHEGMSPAPAAEPSPASQPTDQGSLGGAGAGDAGSEDLGAGLVPPETSEPAEGPIEGAGGEHPPEHQGHGGADQGGGNEHAGHEGHHMS